MYVYIYIYINTLTNFTETKTTIIDMLCHSLQQHLHLVKL